MWFISGAKGEVSTMPCYFFSSLTMPVAAAAVAAVVIAVVSCCTVCVLGDSLPAFLVAS